MIKAKKRYGQNFLKDASILEKIIESMPNESDVVAEIGPGLGDLTKYLVNVKSVEAFEVDTELCALLQERFAREIQSQKLRLHCGDVLKAWDGHLLKQRYDLVANLPYYIATAVVLKALRDAMCRNILVMVQLEVAQKFCAASGERAYGALSVIAQSVARCKIIQKVSPDSFVPAPKVESAILLLQKHANREDEEFERLLKVAFSQPRKTLMKNLSSSYQKQRLQELYKQLAIDPTLRPHQLSIDNYHQLYTLLKESSDGTDKTGCQARGEGEFKGAAKKSTK